MTNKNIQKAILDDLKKYDIVSSVDDKNCPDEVVIYSKAEPSLSSYMPILQNFNLKIDKELSYSTIVDDLQIYIRRYKIIKDKSQLKESKQSVKEVLDSVLRFNTLNNPINSLSIKANISNLEIGLLEAIIAYEDQLLPEQSSQSIQKTLIKYHDITRLFVDYFFVKFDPKIDNKDSSLIEIQKKITLLIKDVSDITDDKILNLFNDILKATLRTNFYTSKRLFYENALSFKIDVTKLGVYLKGVQPKIETFVFHNDFVGTHLRRSKVSRGGLRWSDRELDYRKEIKSLMQAQRSKNSVIIPKGAKGGFYIKKQNLTSQEFKSYYSKFINALLDMVDNYSDEKIIPQENIVKYDDNDPYFVVAADKGTSAMSDTANEISIKRGFWLGDAFASGGSKGFNHKQMGITAKGAIKATQRFFLENSIDFYKQNIKVVGIGSPAGDVFGNGIQLSDKFLLLGAISSRDIFIDPTPNAKKSHNERKRLFDAGLGWSHYNTKLISKGGGIFKKSDKSIKLTKEIKELFGIKKDTVNGEELSKAILSAKVDLLFNGGVGTYVRGNDENDSSIGDKPNESVRINASELKVYAICEGGNLGLTQKARVDFAKKGGRLNADSIDNSAGVHTSDYEVNIKIILNTLVNKGVITEKNRLDMLHSLEDEIARRVLWTNYSQSLAISLDEKRSKDYLDKFKKVIDVLQRNIDNFVAKDYEIPLDLENGLSKTKMLLRPHLSVLLSFSKIFLKTQILKDKKFLESRVGLNFLYKYFPKSFATLYHDDIEKHPLRDEIIATSIANLIINTQGVGFIYDFNELGADEFMLKIKLFLLFNNIISANDIRHEIYREDYNIEIKKQYSLLFDLEQTLEFLGYWVLEHGKDSTMVFEKELEYKQSLTKFIDTLHTKVPKICNNWHINKFFAMLDYVNMLTTIIEVKERTKHDFVEIANIFFKTTQELGILELIGDIKSIETSSNWEKRLQSRLIRQTIDTTSGLIENIMHFKREYESIDEAFDNFILLHKHRYEMYKNDQKALKNTQAIGLINTSVVIGTLAKIIK